MESNGSSGDVYSCQACLYPDTDDMVQCDTCNGWYHYVCAGPDITDDIANYTWNCDRCVVKQFNLTLKENRKQEQQMNTSDFSFKTMVNMDRNSEVGTSVLNDSNLAIKLIEAQQKLEEEQLVESFEIRRKFLHQRYQVLKLRENEEMEEENNHRHNEIINSMSNQPKEVTSRQVRFNSSQLDNDRHVKWGFSTPMRAPSTKSEGINIDMSSINNKENLSQESEIPCQHPEVPSQDRLLVPEWTNKYQNLFPNNLKESTNRFNLGNVTSVGNNSRNQQSKQSEIFPNITSVCGKQGFENNVPVLNQQLASVPVASGESTILNQITASQRRISEQRFNILNQRENVNITSPIESIASVGDWLDQRKDLSTKQVPFGSTKLTKKDDSGRNFKPMWKSSTKFEASNENKHQQNQEEVFGSGQLLNENNSGQSQQQTSALMISGQPSVLNSNQIAARHVLPRDLPKFFGSPKEWPMFISSYESATTTGGYSNADNLIRLQRCLQGKAMEAVRSILLAPENVPNVIETLRMMYGRPDLIIHSLIQQIRDEPAPKLERLETIINYALSVRNLCSVIQSTHLEAHMNNPYPMQEILDKLPSTMRLEWSRYKRTIPNATMMTMGNWLYDVAQAASDVITPCVTSKEKDRGKSKSNENDFEVSSYKDKLYQPTQL